MKFEIASELGINLKQGYNGDLPSRQAGYIGGYMVKNIWPIRPRMFAFGHRIVAGHRGEVECVTVLPDGRVVSGSDDNTLRVWDTKTGQCLDVWDPLEVGVSAMNFSCAALSPELCRTLWRVGAKVPPDQAKLFAQGRLPEA